MSQLADKLIEAAKVSRRDGRFSDALHDVTRAVVLCRESGDQLRLITSLKAVGHVAADLKNYQGSRAAYSEAVELSRDSANPSVLAHSVRHLGDAFSKLGDSDHAEANYREALALYRGNGEISGFDHANALRSLALLLDSTNRSAEAVQLWEEARGLYAAADFQPRVMECSARLGT